jgi:hypothetical protein
MAGKWAHTQVAQQAVKAFAPEGSSVSVCLELGDELSQLALKVFGQFFSLLDHQLRLQRQQGPLGRSICIGALSDIEVLKHHHGPSSLNYKLLMNDAAIRSLGAATSSNLLSRS